MCLARLQEPSGPSLSSKDPAPHIIRLVAKLLGLLHNADLVGTQRRLLRVLGGEDGLARLLGLLGRLGRTRPFARAICFL